jgi:hypothetical protein
MAAMGVVVPALVAAQPAHGLDRRFAFMQALMRAAFPGLDRHESSVVIRMSTASDYRWDRPPMVFVDVYPGKSSSDPPAATPGNSSPYLQGRFEFIDEKLLHAGFDGSAVNESRRNALDKRDEDAPTGLTDTQLAGVLSELGAQFGPDKRTELLRQLDLPRFEAALGKSESVDVAFVSKRHPKPATYSGGPRWRVLLTTLLDGEKECFVLMLEPFGGRLTGVVRGVNGCP